MNFFFFFFFISYDFFCGLLVIFLWFYMLFFKMLLFKKFLFYVFLFFFFFFLYKRRFFLRVSFFREMAYFSVYRSNFCEFNAVKWEIDEDDLILVEIRVVMLD